MRLVPQQSGSNLGKDRFDSSVIEAARAYHQQIGAGHAKSNVPVEVAAFIAGACWGARMFFAEKVLSIRNQDTERSYEEDFGD